MVPEARVEGDCEAVIILAVVVTGDDDGEYELSSTVLRDVDITEVEGELFVEKTWLAGMGGMRLLAPTPRSDRFDTVSTLWFGERG